MQRIILSIISLLLLSGCGFMSDEVKMKEHPIKEDLSFHYARKTCNKKQKEWYDQIYRSLMNFDKELVLEMKEKDDFVEIYTKVLDDHPDIYWSGDITYREEKWDNNAVERTISFKYTKSKKQIKAYNKQLKTIVSKIKGEVDNMNQDYDKVKYIYDYVIDHSVYDTKSSDNQNIISVLINGKSVCAGYAKSIQYLCNQIKIPCTYMPGKSKVSGFSSENNGAHAWNMVQINGNYYYLDATFGDDEENDFRYAYFTMSSDEMLELYKPTYEYEESNAIDDNYFVKEDAYFNDYNEDKMNRLISEAKLKGYNTIMLKCSDETISTKIKQILIDDYRFFELAKQQGIELQNIKYIEVPKVHVLVLLM
ncbi:MAG: transglutaminase domain-containing protein [Erysipelotrichaceae bacterium]